MKRQTWLRHRIPTNTRAPLAAYTCLILGQISRHGGVMWGVPDDSFNPGQGRRTKDQRDNQAPTTRRAVVYVPSLIARLLPPVAKRVRTLNSYPYAQSVPRWVLLSHLPRGSPPQGTTPPAAGRFAPASQ